MSAAVIISTIGKQLELEEQKVAMTTANPGPFQCTWGRPSPCPGTESNLRPPEKVQDYCWGTRATLLGDGCRLGREGFPEEVAVRRGVSQKYFGVPGGTPHCELLGPA